MARLRRIAVAVALCIASLAAVAPGSAAALEQIAIGGTGPIEAIMLGDDLSCQVAWVNDVDFEFYPPGTTPGDCGTFLAVDGTLYAPDFAAHDVSATGSLGDFVPFEPVSQTPVIGSGSAADPFRVRTVVDAPGTSLQLIQEVSYVAGAHSYRVETSVESSGRDDANAVLYHAGDCYASGSDIGYGFTRPEIGSAGCSQAPDNVPAGRTIQMAPLSSGSSYYEAFFSQVWDWISTQAPFPDTCRCGEHVDNGVGLSWSFTLPGEGRATRALTVSFTETVQPSPGADGDGDALPDAWELGPAPSGDFENLAVLGADPNRKDIFVQADWMAGCAPPPGWELDAIETFAKHGVALHVDSGPDSYNADGSRWGARSRAGELPAVADLPIWGEHFDALKDPYFVPSNRRRAFHYMAWVYRFNNDDGSGQSRGFGDADFIATCAPSPVRGVDRRRWMTITFVHELGHNLGLRHGGDDDDNIKPSYYSIMNYGWGAFGGTRLPRRLVPRGEVGRRLPNFSDSVRPSLVEDELDERAQVAMPVAHVCPDVDRSDGVQFDEISYTFGYGADVVDWDCDGTWYEGPKDVDVNGDARISELTGHDDWAALRFDGGGVLGDFDVPPRHNPPIEPEPSIDDVARVSVAVTRALRAERKQLRVFTSRRRVKARRATTLRVRVRAGGRAVRNARVRVRGARLLKLRKARSSRRARSRKPRGLRTDRRGRLTVRVRPKRRGDVRIVAVRRGFERGGVVVAVKRRR